MSSTEALPELIRLPAAAEGADLYETVAGLSDDVIRCPEAFTGLLASAPHEVGDDEWAQRWTRHATLRRWQATSLDLLAASLAGDAPPTVAAAFLDHLPDHLGWQHHRSIPVSDVRLPQFFRTDETADGKLLEVQCPGSMWGVHEILRDAYSVTGHEATHRLPVLSAAFCDQLQAVVGTRPIVHHLIDNSSHPAGERYFIQRARSGSSYFGYDRGVRPRECNFVRAHDFPSLLNENFVAERLEMTRAGAQLYDLPPVAFFDQKLLIALPFWEETRQYYDDEVRGLFPHTTVVTPQGILLETGEVLGIDRFCALPRRQRNFYLKYAGSDVTRNWGSRSVFHLGKLSQPACRALLTEAAGGYVSGERWIVQREQSSRMELPYLTRAGESDVARGHAKVSTFYGPGGPMAVLIMVESFYKVHGSTHTVTAVGALPWTAIDHGGESDEDRC